MDDRERFLRELRQLRDYAGLGEVELAARAHYPHDYIRAAETGPALPDLPLLSAYVRGCGGTIEVWEERWRQLTDTPALRLLPTRSAGASNAANAGTRIGLAFQAVEAPDQAAIMAALNRVAEKITADPAPPPHSSRATLPSTAQFSAAPAPAMSAPAMSAPAASATSMPATSMPATATPVPGMPAPGMPVPDLSAPGVSASAALASSGTGAATSARPYAAVHAPAGRPFSLTSRTTIAALVALAICVIVAVLAVFA